MKRTRVLAVGYDAARVRDCAAVDGPSGARLGIAAGPSIPAVDCRSGCGERVGDEGDENAGDDRRAHLCRDIERSVGEVVDE